MELTGTEILAQKMHIDVEFELQKKEGEKVGRANDPSEPVANVVLPVEFGREGLGPDGTTAGAPTTRLAKLSTSVSVANPPAGICEDVATSCCGAATYC